MPVAQLRVTFAGPFVTVQDGGRFGRLRFGVPESGPMDRLAHAAANVSVGNMSTASAIEVSRGGIVLECGAGSVTLAVAGGQFAVEHAGQTVAGWTVLTIHAGERLAVRAGRSGSWAYVAFAGRLAAGEWLDSTSTHSMSGLGGGALISGQLIEIEQARVDAARDGEIPEPGFARSTGRVRVLMGPQDHHFREAAITAFTSSPYRLTDAYDRMGVRLDGPALPLRDVLSIPSEPIVRGSIQVAGDGVPTVLLADHQTTGGYPKIATVLDADLDAFVQLRTGDVIEFDAVETSEAIEIARSRAAQVADYLAATAGPGRTITHRLRTANLISGAVADHPVPGRD
jgi:biotin-dependent carboxylase-like uncharacterized protein